LNPAVRNSIRSCDTPTVCARNAWVSRTLWHTPTTFDAGSRDPLQMPQGTIAIGFV
jgi:hypothetical protein